MIRFIKLLAIMISALVLAASAHAQPTPRLIYWQSGTGALTDANYSDGTTMNLGPQPTTDLQTDYLHIGNNGIVTFTGTAGFGRLRVGHNQTPPGGVGAGTLTVTGAGTFLELVSGAAAPNAAVWVGNGNNGELNVQDGAELKANRLVVVGAGNNNTATGTLNVRNGGILTVADGNLSIADRSGNSGNGVKGVVNLSGATSSIAINGSGADLVIGARSRVGTYNQSDGIVTIADSVDLAPQNGDSTGSSFNISGGSITTGTTGTGNFFVGRGASVGATVSISGTATVNVGNRYLMGGSDNPASPAVPTAIATGVVTNHSGGTLNTDLDIRVADAFISSTSDATYNLSGTGVINSTTGGVIGRQGIGKFIQSGGTANFNGTVSIGNREAATTTTATGLYKISAGDLNITGTVPTPPATAQIALNIAPAGTGEFRVVGDDATIDLTGDLNIFSTADGNGTLAFELETGELLSRINVTGIATFNANSILAFDAMSVSPTQTSYDLLTAADIVNSGLSFTGPTGWGFEIVVGGNGKILRAVQTGPATVPGDYNNSGTVDAADYVLWRNGGPLQNEINTPGTVDQTDYDAWRANFGKPGSGSGSGLNAGQVPEPAAAVLMLLGFAAVFGRRRRS